MRHTKECSCGARLDIDVPGAFGPIECYRASQAFRKEHRHREPGTVTNDAHAPTQPHSDATSEESHAAPSEA